MYLITILLLGATLYPPLTQAEKTAFQEKVQAALASSRQHEKDLWQEMQNSKTILTAADKIAVEKASTQTAVKETLANEFVGANSLRSPLVRSTLLDLLNKDEVTAEDLLKLQSVVDKEKPLIEASDKEKVNP